MRLPVAASIKDIPDYVALQRLGKSLWRDGETRGAALLIGAGFSCFAKLPGLDTKSPPLWPDLRGRMVNQVYPRASEGQAPSDPLRLAEEYRAMLGQAALDDFIREQVPDMSWEPGELHERLLTLPWADVLTTNWDTLLERSASSLVDSNYDSIRVATDIARAKPPRIVKLHGSLPSGPFIFAEEDYRTYPAKHAAFVNLARQIFLENELCLLGFSGNDPNFLQWSGWVRDHLGGGARRIYLVGVLNLALAARRLLESRNVVPVDLAPLVNDLPPSVRHVKAISLFLEYLKNAKPKPFYQWPTERPIQPGMTAAEYDRLFKDTQFAAEKLKEEAVVWRKERCSYPGWLICPHDKRWQLRHGTDLNVLRREVLDHLPPKERGPILFELAWRCEKTYLPVQDRIFESMVEAFEKADSFSLTSIERLELGSILLRIAREEDRLALFEKLADALDKLDDPNTDVSANVAYQRCLRLRDELQYTEIWKHIKAISGPDPIWKLRQASIRSDIGDDQGVHALVLEAAAELRNRHQRDRRSIWVLSRRAWAEYLARAVEFESGWRSGNYKDREWPLDYKAARCDPWDELGGSEREIEKRQRDEGSNAFDVKPHFDAGTFSEVKGRHRPPESWRLVSPAYEFARLAEDAGLPSRIGYVTIRQNLAEKAFPFVFRPTELWYCRLLSVAVHGYNDESFDRYFNRNAIACMSVTLATNLFELTRKAIDYWRDQADPETERSGKRRISFRAVEHIQLFIEVLSRLVLRLSPECALQMWEFANELVKDKQFRNWQLWEPVGHLLQRAAEATPLSRRGSLGLSAFQFPLRSEVDCNGFDYHWPNPINYLGDCKLTRAGNSNAWSARIGELIAAVESGRGREEALSRLSILTDNDVLSAEEREAFGRALYSQTDDKTGLPLARNFYHSAFLRLPAPDPTVPITHFTDVVFKLSKSVTDNFENFLISIKMAAHKGLADGSNLMPSREDSVKMLDALLNWRPQAGCITSRISREIGPATYFAIAPCLDAADITDLRVEALFRAIEDVPAPSLAQVLPAFVRLRPDIEVRACDEIHRLLWSPRFADVSGASGALVRWAAQSRYCPVPQSVIEELLLAIRTAQEGGLVQLIWAAGELLSESVLTEEHKESLAGSLDNLRAKMAYEEMDQSAKVRVSLSIVRRECVRLAKKLYDQGTGGGGVRAWLDARVIDPLPEVRFAFEDDVVEPAN